MNRVKRRKAKQRGKNKPPKITASNMLASGVLNMLLERAVAEDDIESFIKYSVIAYVLTEEYGPGKQFTERELLHRANEILRTMHEDAVAEMEAKMQAAKGEE